MKVWITKSALTNGIQEVDDAEICEGSSTNMIRVPSLGCHPYFHGKGREWHDSKESALKKAEEMRKAKIESLFKQIYKLEGMKFE